MIHVPIIQEWSCVDSYLDWRTIELLVIELHLAGCVQNSLWTVFRPFHIANAILKRCWNNSDACRIWVAVGCVRGTKLGDNCFFHCDYAFLKDSFLVYKA